VEGIPLSQAELHVPHRLVRVLMQDEERLRYLGSLGLYINATVTLLERAPFEGPLLIDVNGTHHALAHEMAQRLLVTVAEAEEASAAQPAEQPPEQHPEIPADNETANKTDGEDV
jgi:Fe2+ transport system protein FeoA